MKRYAVVSHSLEEQILQIRDGNIIGKQPIHDLVSNYHWARLDSTSIILFASYSVSNHFRLDNHPKVSMLPHIGSNKTVHSHVHKHARHKDKDKHLHALKIGLNITENHTMEDFIDEITAKHGHLFAPSM